MAVFSYAIFILIVDVKRSRCRIIENQIHLIDRWIVSVTMLIATIKSAFVKIIEQ